MNALGCLVFAFIAACVMALIIVMAFWVIAGTLMILTKLIVWMAYLGAAFVVVGILAFLAVRIYEIFES